MKKSKFRTIELTYVGMFAALMAIGANITAFAPFLQIAGIPLSMQPFFAILAGLLLGSRLGAISMFVYMLIGLAGAPVFANFKAGFAVVMGNTGGFILSYILVSYVVGKIVEFRKDPKLPTFMVAAFVGIILIYFIGTNYMYLAVNTWLKADISYSAAWVAMAWFSVKDIAFTILSAIIAPRIFYTLQTTSLHQLKGKTNTSA